MLKQLSPNDSIDAYIKEGYNASMLAKMIRTQCMLIDDVRTQYHAVGVEQDAKQNFQILVSLCEAIEDSNKLYQLLKEMKAYEKQGEEEQKRKTVKFSLTIPAEDAENFKAYAKMRGWLAVI